MSRRRFRNRDVVMAVGLSGMLAGTVWLVIVKAIAALTEAGVQ